ncbi:MAG: hypothetical protein P9L88_02160 [Candidatus Tantalella remota]|nr:hypothetical protein [Candidatus Tantalella remota]
MKRLTIIMILVCFLCTPVHAEGVRVGTTYSDVQSRYLGLNEDVAYTDVLKSGFGILRLGAYWDEIEKEKGQFDFFRLDRQIWQAEEACVPLVITVGMKAPRWPEYFIPAWVLEEAKPAFGADLSKNEYLKKRTLIFLEKVVSRYRDEAIIKYWQVENEPMSRMGAKKWFIGKEFLGQEVALVRELDGGRRPIVMTTATYPNVFLRLLARLSVRHDPIKETLEMCDILGLNVYPMVGYKFWKFRMYFRTTRNDREKYLSRVISFAKSMRKETWIVELQAEPWEPGHLAYQEEEIPPTGWPAAAEESFAEARKLGIETIFLWGAEYWLFRELRYQDTGWKDLLKELLRESQPAGKKE